MTNVVGWLQYVSSALRRIWASNEKAAPSVGGVDAAQRGDARRIIHVLRLRSWLYGPPGRERTKRRRSVG